MSDTARSVVHRSTARGAASRAGRRAGWLAAVGAAVLACGCAVAPAGAAHRVAPAAGDHVTGQVTGRVTGRVTGQATGQATDQFTPVVATTLNAGSPAVHGTDDRWHLVYELQLTNAKPVPATLHEIRVLDADRPDRVVAAFSGADLEHRLRDLTGKSPAGSLTIEPWVSRLVLVDLSFAARRDVPAALLHRFLLDGAGIAGAPTPVPLDYTAAPYRTTGGTPTLGPPLAGGGWVAVNGCCGSDGVHRTTVLPVDGHLADTQRFAIDWMRLDDQGRFVHGDPADVHSYTAYGAQVLAVADGTVVSTLDDLDDQVPGSLPDPATITLANVDGNHVVLDLGGGHYAFFAHLQKGSVTVEPGDRVHRGEVLGLLGNSGNTSAPHLHFHLMDGPSVLGSDGLPYTYDRLGLAGHVDRSLYTSSFEGDWGQGLLPQPQPQTDRFPLDLDVVDFPG